MLCRPVILTTQEAGAGGPRVQSQPGLKSPFRATVGKDLSFSVYIILFIYVSCLHVFVCTTRMPGVGGSQKKASDSRELELLGVVSYHVDAGNQTRLSSRAAIAPNLRAIFMSKILWLKKKKHHRCSSSAM